MVRRLTHNEFIEKFMKQNSNAENIEILGEYVNNQTKIKCKCKICNYEWEARPSKLLMGRGCHNCNMNKRKTHEQFIREMLEINSDIEILGKYTNARTKVECKCKICNYEWKSTPHDLLSGRGCYTCYNNNMRGNSQRLSHEEFVKRLSEINSDIEVLGEYINNHTPIECKCKLDGHKWSPIPSNLLSNKGCPICNAPKGEKIIAKYFKEHGVEFKEQYKFINCRFKKELPFDFYIPNLNIAIEYDGEDHYKIFIRSNNQTYEEAMDRFIDRKIRDTIKTIYCEENNIRLIRIPYWEFDNIENILDKIF